MDFGSGRLAPEELQHRVGALGLCLVAYADGVPAETASLDIRDVEIDEKPLRCGLCRALGVLLEYAGLGIATRLFEEHEKAARALFCRRIYVGTHPHNQRASGIPPASPSTSSSASAIAAPTPKKPPLRKTSRSQSPCAEAYERFLPSAPRIPLDQRHFPPLPQPVLTQFLRH